MVCQFGRAFLIVASLLALVATPSTAKTIQIAAPGSPKADAATENIMDVIKTMRNGGLTREADQMEKLLKNGQAYYRTSGPNMYDAQFVHDLTDDDKSTLYFSVYQVNYVQGKGPERFTGADGSRQLYKTIVTSLHELIHKDQGRASIIASDNMGASRGYSLHEIEAYRTAMKKFADRWIIDEMDRFLNDRDSMENDELSETLLAMRHMLDALRGSLGAPAKYGDKACRWTAIQAEIKKLSDDLDGLWLDAVSRQECRQHRGSSDIYKQAAIEIRLKFDNLGKAMTAEKANLDGMAKAYKDGQNEYSGLRTELEDPATTADRRREIADRIGRLTANQDDLRERYNRLVGEYNGKIADRKKLRADYDKAVQNQDLYDQCRIASVTKRMVKFKLGTSRLPPDMVKQADGTIGLLSEGKRRPIDLAAARDRLKDMFAFDTELLGPIDAALSDDPRTPCYQPKTATAPKPKNTVAKPKVKCSGGGLVAAMDCVTEHIEQGQ